MYNAMDRLLLSSTQWNYTVSNRNDPMIGDGWNQEDFSVWSADQETTPNDPNSGSRALLGFCRPYARAVQGTPVLLRFDSVQQVYELIFDADPSLDAATEIYVPVLRFTDGIQILLNEFQLDLPNDLQLIRTPPGMAGQSSA